MNIKKLLPIGVLCGIVIIALVFVITDANKEEDHSLDKLSSAGTTTTEQPTTEVPSTEIDTTIEATEVTEAETDTTAEEPVPEPDPEELARIEEIDAINRRIFAKNPSIPTVVAYSGVDVSELMLVDNCKVGGFWYHDGISTEQYFIQADCDMEHALSCMFSEPIISILKTDESKDGRFEEYYVETDSHTYEISYDYETNEIYRVYKDSYITVNIMNEEDANAYIERNLSGDNAPGCGCGCGEADPENACVTAADCDGITEECVEQ